MQLICNPSIKIERRFILSHDWKLSPHAHGIAVQGQVPVSKAVIKCLQNSSVHLNSCEKLKTCEQFLTKLGKPSGSFSEDRGLTLVAWLLSLVSPVAWMLPEQRQSKIPIQGFKVIQTILQDCYCAWCWITGHLFYLFFSHQHNN